MKKEIICLGFLCAIVSISSVAYSQIATTSTDFRSGCCSHHGGEHIVGKAVTTFAMMDLKVQVVAADKNLYIPQY